MFAHRKSGVLDLLAASLCLWAAAYHTPVGALIRGTIAKISGSKAADVRPLLAYYSGGVYDAREVQSPVIVVGAPPVEALASIDVGPALGRGVVVALKEAQPEQQRTAIALTRSYQLDSDALADPRRGPDVAAKVIGHAQAELGSEEAAVLAIFAGLDSARYALERTKAERRPPTLENLAQQLPPSRHAALAPASQALTLATAWTLAWPVPANTRISSPFGYRNHPTLGRQQLHTGVDLAVAAGTDVHVTADGTVRRASEDAVNGRVVIVDHGRGVSTAYCHNTELLVKVGQTVSAGEVVAHSGNTGRSTGPHVHYQVELARQPVDPLAFKGELKAGLIAPGFVVRKPTPVVPEAPKPASPKTAKPSQALKDAFARVLDGGADEPADERTVAQPEPPAEPAFRLGLAQPEDLPDATEH